MLSDMAKYKINFDIFFQGKDEFPHIQGTVHCYSEETVKKFKQKIMNWGAKSEDIRIYKVETVNM